MQAHKIQEQYDVIVARAHADASFKERLLQNTKAVLLEYGIVAPAGKEIKIVENSNTIVHLILPEPAPMSAEESGLPGTGFCSWRKLKDHNKEST